MYLVVVWNLRSQKTSVLGKLTVKSPRNHCFLPQELLLLQNTLAQDLLRTDAFRAKAMASRIQRFWRCRSSSASLLGDRRQGSATSKAVAPCYEAEILPSDKKIIAPEIKWYRRCARVSQS